MKTKFNLTQLAADIVNHNLLIEKIFIGLLVLAIGAQALVGVNYDLTTYLPADSQTKKGVDLVKSQFDYTGNARVMISDVSLSQAAVYQQQLSQLEGVKSVTWLDSINGSAYLSTGFQTRQTKIDDYYHDHQAVMGVVFTAGDNDPQTAAAIDEIYRLLGDRVAMTGPAVSSKNLSENVAKEMPKILVCGIALILLILLATTNSWFEPVLFLVTMGAAIILNLGSNLIFNQISFLSSSIAAVLQLAIAMDYSIFLLHTFAAEKTQTKDTKQAIKAALVKAIPAIFASALTTIVGFLALVLMRFRIGADIGLVLAKSIVWSLLTVVFLMPALIIRWNHLIERTTHRSFVPDLNTFAQKIFRGRYLLLVVIMVVFIPSVVAQKMNHYMYGTEAMSTSEGSQAYAEKQLIEDNFGPSSEILLVVPNRGLVLEKQLTTRLADLSAVKSITSLAEILPVGLPTSFLPTSLTTQLQTPQYTRLLLSLNVSGESDQTFAVIDEIKALAVTSYGKDNVYLVGNLPATQDIKTTIVADYQMINLLSILGVALVIFFSFKSLALTLVVIMPIEAAIIVNTGLPFVYGETLSFLGYLMVSSMQLGATVDYSILLTNNYLAWRRQGMKKNAAAMAAIRQSALSIMTSGVVLTTVGYTIYFVSSIATIGDLGRLIGRGAFISMVLVLCLLPFLLTLIDQLIITEQHQLPLLWHKFRKHHDKK